MYDGQKITSISLFAVHEIEKINLLWLQQRLLRLGSEESFVVSRYLKYNQITRFNSRMNANNSKIFANSKVFHANWVLGKTLPNRRTVSGNCWNDCLTRLCESPQYSQISFYDVKTIPRTCAESSLLKPSIPPFRYPF